MLCKLFRFVDALVANQWKYGQTSKQIEIKWIFFLFSFELCDDCHRFQRPMQKNCGFIWNIIIRKQLIFAVLLFLSLHLHENSMNAKYRNYREQIDCIWMKIKQIFLSFSTFFFHILFHSIRFACTWLIDYSNKSLSARFHSQFSIEIELSAFGIRKRAKKQFIYFSLIDMIQSSIRMHLTRSSFSFSVGVGRLPARKQSILSSLLSSFSLLLSLCLLLRPRS